jgi:hypothetical protein
MVIFCFAQASSIMQLRSNKLNIFSITETGQKLFFPLTSRYQAKITR